jgi:hypothetical protein
MITRERVLKKDNYSKASRDDDLQEAFTVAAIGDERHPENNRVRRKPEYGMIIAAKCRSHDG